MTVRKSSQKPKPKVVPKKVTTQAELLDSLIGVANGQKEAIEQLIKLVGASMRFQSELNQTCDRQNPVDESARVVNMCQAARPVGNVTMNSETLQVETQLFEERLALLERMLESVLRDPSPESHNGQASGPVPVVTCRVSHNFATAHERMRAFRGLVDSLIDRLEV